LDGGSAFCKAFALERKEQASKKWKNVDDKDGTKLNRRKIMWSL
jgi:hypothetical protein